MCSVYYNKVSCPHQKIQKTKIWLLGSPPFVLIILLIVTASYFINGQSCPIVCNTILMDMCFNDKQCTSNILKLNANPLNLHSKLNFEDDTSSMQRSVNFISKVSCSHLNHKTNEFFF